MNYRVVGRNEVLGYAHGEEFEMILDPVTETRLIAGGHIERVGKFEYKVPEKRGESVPDRDADDPDED